ncbi:hypothetical protein NAB33_15275 [Proteus mirabilis]|uniref:hypothetical protein n=1 Tax=Proteus mirabilis TaxID=584 RepID=UPI0020249B49|nr:hypothetical protein [Proteus mirabilis]MCL8585700.1 hypothetical protein [Proteus mirabilis]MDF7339455.1 hypothetical protein [Proteus mirabilis]
MSNKNKGRVGETRVIRVITDIMDAEGNVDFTRHTNTNTADGGADIVLEHPEGFIDTLLEIAEPQKTESSDSNNEDKDTTQNKEPTNSITAEDKLQSTPSSDSDSDSDKPVADINKSESQPESNKTKSTTEKTRIDVKNTDSKLGKDTVIKFGGDVRKNPDCKNHVLLGGKALTKGAQDELTSLQEAYSKSGKKIVHVTNNGLSNIESHYKALNSPENSNQPEPESENNGSSESNSESQADTNNH